MCFILSKDPKNKTVKIAEKDIPCHKLLEFAHYDYADRWLSPYEYEYYFNNDDESVHMTVDCIQIVNDDQIYEGLHTWSNKKRAASHRNCELFKAIIPKGTLYYYNERHKQYVSEALIVFNHHYKPKK